jgi:hypothetical protein
VTGIMPLFLTKQRETEQLSSKNHGQTKMSAGLPGLLKPERWMILINAVDL